MARLPRLALADQVHLVIQRAIEGRPAFADEIDRRAYLDALRHAAHEEHVAVHAFALLDQEAWLVLTPPTPQALSRLVQAVGRRYVGACNRRHARRGPLWEGRFRSAVIEPARVLEATVFVDGQSDAPGLTSAAHRSGGAREALITDPPAYWQLGNTPFEREAAYRALLERGTPPAQAERLRRSALGGWAYGGAGFVEGLQAQAARPLHPRPRGRPRRTP